MTVFRKYDHLERFGTEEVEGIEIGEVLIFPKIDGSNASIWAQPITSVGDPTAIPGDQGWTFPVSFGQRVYAGSRNRILSDESDNAGFHAWVQKQEWMRNFFEAHPDWTIYGEWLVEHTIKTYRDDAWQRFWAFDVFCRDKGKYLHYDIYAPILQEAGFDVIEPIIRYKSPPTEQQLIWDAQNNTYLMQDGHVGEGVVIKNYDFVNKCNRTTWAKLVRAEFKEENRRAFGTTEKEGEKSVEGEIAEKYVTKALVDKTLAKIKLDGEFERRTGIPRLLQTVFYDLVREETWNYVKEHNNPVIDYKKLRNYTTYWIKKHVPELF